MKNNKTDATNVLKFFREAKEARQGEQNNLDMMSYGGDPPTKVAASEVKTIGKVTPGGSTNSVGKPKGSYKQQITRG